MSTQVLKFAWPDVASLTSTIVPPFDAGSHKGSMGRIGVIGGSQDYCGAPYYAAVSALKFGADLSWVYCSQEAAIPIKSYSPELMVTPFYEDNQLLNLDAKEPQSQELFQTSADRIVASFPRLHTLLVGPGLGRHANVMNVVGRVINAARRNNIPLVVDADGLFLVTNNLHLVLNYSNCILTPNPPEFERLAAATTAYYNNNVYLPTDGSGTGSRVQYWLAQLSSTTPPAEDHTTTSTPAVITTATATATTSAPPLTPLEVVHARRVLALSQLLGGVTVLSKGAVDVIASGAGTSTDEICSNGEPDAVAYVLSAQGSPRRCGGLGDILSGITAASLHWATMRTAHLPDLATTLSTHPSIHSVTIPLAHTDTAPASTANTKHNALVHACIFASTVSKKAAEEAFSRKGRSMTAPDVIECVGEAFIDVYGDK